MHARRIEALHEFGVVERCTRVDIQEDIRLWVWFRRLFFYRQVQAQFLCLQFRWARLLRLKLNNAECIFISKFSTCRGLRKATLFLDCIKAFQVDYLIARTLHVQPDLPTLFSASVSLLCVLVMVNLWTKLVMRDDSGLSALHHVVAKAAKGSACV